MGRRQRGGLDLQFGQGAVLVLLGVFFAAGGAAGCLFAGMADGEGGASLARYLADYLTLASGGTVERSFWPILWQELRYFAAAAVLGVTALGVIGMPVLFCVRGFFFAFSVACFCRVFGGIGLVPALVLFGLPALLWAPALFLTGVQGLLSARCLLGRGLGDVHAALPFTPFYWLRIGICGLLTLACALAEYAAVPILLRAAARVVL